MIKLGYVENVEKILKSLFIVYDIFDGIQHPNATVSFVEDGLACFANKLNVVKRQYHFIISIGGGTNHDCAKSIATVAANGGAIQDYEGYNKVTKPILPLITINTTAGSSADITATAIITDNTRKVKMNITSAYMTPFMSVNDPIFMMSMPKEVTASSGIDVISHAIEGYIATEASPITDALALNALKTAYRFLPRAYENGNDLEAREQMMYAALMAGMNYNNAGLGCTHALSHQLGGFYNQTHGFYNSVLLPYVFNFNAASVPEERILHICEALGEKTDNRLKAVDIIIEKLNKLCSDLNAPRNLKEMGLLEEDIEQLSKNAIKDITVFTNPRQATVNDMADILKAAM